MNAIFWLIDALLGLAYISLIISVVSSWLVAFGVINSYQPLVQAILSFVHAITEPILKPIRRIIPPVNGMDLSPLVALLLIHFLRIFIAVDVRGAMMS